jgi:hypothetical protein
MFSQIKWLLVSLIILLVCSCRVSHTKTTYHEFTNENDVEFDRELFSVDVFHQIYDEHLVISMINKSTTDVLVNLSRSAIVYNNIVVPMNVAYIHSESLFDQTDTNDNKQLKPIEIQQMDVEKHIIVLPAGHMYQVRVQISTQLYYAKISLKDTSAAIDIEARYTFSELDESSSYTNIYNLKRIGVSAEKTDQIGSNVLTATETTRKIDAKATVKGFFQGVGYVTILILAFMIKNT